MQTMNDTQTVTRPVIPAMRVMIIIASIQVFILGTGLYLFAGSTDRYFAWTVNPAITAAFMGAAFLASGVLEVFSARARNWSDARTGVIAVIIYAYIMLGVTLYHLDRFNTDAPQGWIWIGVYAIFPTAEFLALVRQLTTSGEVLPRTDPLNPLLRWVIALQALILLALGLLLLAAPLSFDTLWPWTLSALTGRAIGAWLIGFGIATAQTAFENDAHRVRPAAIAWIVVSLLLLVALARYQSALDWGNPASWGYVVFVVSIGLVGIAELRTPGRSKSQATF